MPADDAVAVGLVDRVVAADDLQAAALAAAAELADRMPADTFAHTKAQLRRDAVARMDTHADEDAHATELWAERIRDGRSRATWPRSPAAEPGSGAGRTRATRTGHRPMRLRPVTLL